MKKIAKYTATINKMQKHRTVPGYRALGKDSRQREYSKFVRRKGNKRIPNIYRMENRKCKWNREIDTKRFRLNFFFSFFLSFFLCDDYNSFMQGVFFPVVCSCHCRSFYLGKCNAFVSVVNLNSFFYNSLSLSCLCANRKSSSTK